MIWKLSLITIILIVIPAAYAEVYGDTQIITDPNLVDDVDNFKAANIALAVLNSTDDIIADAEYYQNLSNADIAIIYDFENNKVAVAKPIKDPVIDDDKLNGLLDERQDEKLLIVDYDDATEYLHNIITGLSNTLAEEKTYSICVLIKDGVCDKSCVGDLDCLCGNNICEYHENFNTCPDDCQPTEDFSCAIISDNYCDENCALTDVDCVFTAFNEKAFRAAKRKAFSAKLIQIILGSAIFILIAILIFIIEKRGYFRK